MGDDQRIEPFPPGHIASLATQKTHHLQHIGNLGRTESRLEGRHQTTAFGDDSADLPVALSLHCLAKIRRSVGQHRCQSAVAAAAGAMAGKTALRVNRVHAVVSPAADKQDQRNEYSGETQPHQHHS